MQPLSDEDKKWQLQLQNLATEQIQLSYRLKLQIDSNA